MKSKVMDRPMFKGKKDDPEEVGIMSLLMGEDDDEEGDEDEDMSSLMDRRPDSPEILMNNLRGDVRSVDARFEELADMVGYGAAQQTPPEVLALLQPVLAAEQQGIAALPAVAPGAAPAGIPTPPPPMGMPAGANLPPGAAPPPMPPQAAGIGSLPQGMAMGGPVQRFRRGSDEDGVEPADTEPSEDNATGGAGRAGSGAVNYAQVLDPAQIAAAKAAFARLFEEPAQSTETLEQAAARKTRLYQSLLGQDKTATQAQMLFDLAGAGLALAGNVDPRTGQPMRGSFAARLAGAASQLPAQIGARASEAEKMTQQIRALGLQSAEKERENDRVARQRREQLIAGIGKEILQGQAAENVANIRAAAAASKAAADRGMTPAVMNALMSNPELIREFASGANTTDTTRLEFAIKNYTQPKTEQYIDPQTNMPVMRTTRNELPGYLSEAINARARALGSRPTAQAPAPAPAGAMPGPATSQAPGSAVSAGTAVPAPVAAPGSVPQIGQAVPTNLYRLASTGTGPIALFNSGVSRIPLIGGKVPPAYEQSVTEIENSVAQLVKSLQQTTRMANAERVDIEQRLSVLPRFIDRPDAFQNRLIALDNVLATIEAETSSKTQQANIGAAGRQEAEKKLSEVQHMRQMIGLPMRVYTRQQALSLPPGTEFYFVPQNRFKRRDPE